MRTWGGSTCRYWWFTYVAFFSFTAQDKSHPIPSPRNPMPSSIIAPPSLPPSLTYSPHVCSFPPSFSPILPPPLYHHNLPLPLPSSQIPFWGPWRCWIGTGGSSNRWTVPFGTTPSQHPQVRGTRREEKREKRNIVNDTHNIIPPHYHPPTRSFNWHRPHAERRNTSRKETEPYGTIRWIRPNCRNHTAWQDGIQ